MEALVAVGFAANILQFVDYVCHVLNVVYIERVLIDSKSLDKLAEECMAVAKELIDFIAKFKSEKDLEPETKTIPVSRSKHQDEVELEKRIDSISLQIIALRKVIGIREAEEKKRERERVREEKIKNDEEKAKKEAERISKAKFKRNLELEFKEDIKSYSKLPADEKLERLLNTAINQKRAVGNAIKEKYGRKEPQEPLKPKPTKPAKRIPGPKHPDTIELDRLISLKQEIVDGLKKVASREDTFFEREKARVRNANDEAKKQSKIRRSIKTFTIAVKLEWNKNEIEALGERLDRIRSQLFSEVMLNIHKSVKDINESTHHSDQVLEDIYVLQSGHQMESLHAIQSNQLTMEKMSTQLHSLDEAASRRHDKVIDLISAFTDVLKDRFLFPALPEILTAVDPSLKPAAFDGYDAIENAVLAALYFRKMNIREAQVQEAYKNTFSWIFKDPKEHQKRWSNFKWWLQNDSGCYWIAGKAGCGKSTLMKFLGSDIRTKAALEQWANSDELITATYFFWMAGTALQKNQEGLLRSLLHTILSRKRDLIARAFPKEYNAMMTKLFADNTSLDIFFSCDISGCSSSFNQPKQLEEHQREHHINNIQDSKHNHDTCGTLTLVELKRAFTTLARQNLKGFKICLFIDGLDEYIGDQKEILDLFKTITSNSAIKAVVSSRPEAIFEEAFRKSPKLRVEKLTSGDINHYVKSKLFSHSRMESEMQESSELGARLVVSIVSKASGVFLWVFLVVRLLLDRLSKGEYPEALEAIIKTYPEELQELYRHMFFTRMEEAHKIEAFRLFQPIHFAQTIESEIPTALRLSFMDRDQPATSIYSPVRILQIEDLQERLSIFESRLKSRCCGLFEVHYYDQDETSYIQEGRVTLLHRTVSDFLNEPSLRRVIEGETLQFTAEIYERLLASILHSFKAWRFFHVKHPREWTKFSADIRSFFIYCHRCESKAGSNPVEYIKELDQQLSHFWRVRASETRTSAYGLALGNYEHHWAEYFLGELRLKLASEPDDDPLLSLAARYGLYTYVCKKLETRPTSEANFLDTAGHSLVLRLSYWAMHDSSLRVQHFRIIELFLKSGLTMNAKSNGLATEWGRTPWQDILALQSKKIPSRTNQLSTVIDIEDENQTEVSEVERLDTWTRLVEMFVKFGAELDVSFKSFKGATRSQTAREAILETMATPLIEESLSSEESVVIEKSRTRIQQLLSDKPVTRPENIIDTNPSNILAQNNSQICLQTNLINDYRPASSQSRQDRRLKSTQNIKHDGPAKFPPTIHTLTTISQPCYRCKAVDKLQETGCTPNEIFEALKKARVGYDVQALLTWILDKNENRSNVSPNTADSLIATTRARPTPPITISGPSKNSATTGLALTQPRDSASRQWQVVPKKEKAPTKRGDIQVVGAQWVSSQKPQKERARKSKGESTPNEKNTTKSGLNSSAGEIEGTGGKFTWFFESRSHSQHIATLSFEQRTQLEELVKSWKT